MTRLQNTQSAKMRLGSPRAALIAVLGDVRHAMDFPTFLAKTDHGNILSCFS
jgi:hypothetical protein